MSHFFESLTKIVFELNAALSQVSNKTGGYEPSAVGVDDGAIVIPSLLINADGEERSSKMSRLHFPQSSTVAHHTFYPTQPQPFFESFAPYVSMPKFVLVSTANASDNFSSSPVSNVFQESPVESIFRVLVPADLGLFETVVHIMLLITCFIIGGITVFLNAIVIRCFFKEPSVRTPSNFFIISLASTDLSIGLISLPVYTMYLILEETWPFGEIFCDMWLAIDYTLCLVSQYTVFAITVDRFFSVKFPAMYHRWLTKPRALGAILTIWVLSGAVFHVTIIGWQYFVGERTVPPNRCYVQFIGSAFFNMIFVIGYFWSTLVVIIILYAQIFVVVWRRSQRTRRITESTLATLRVNMSRHVVNGGNGHQNLLSNNFSSDQSTTGEAPLSPGGDNDDDDGVNFHFEKNGNSTKDHHIFAAGFLGSLVVRFRNTSGKRKMAVRRSESGCLMKASWDNNGQVSVTCNRPNKLLPRQVGVTGEPIDNEDLTPAKRMSTMMNGNKALNQESSSDTTLVANNTDGSSNNNNSSNNEQEEHQDNHCSKTLVSAVDMLTSETMETGYKFSSMAAALTTSRPSLLCDQLLSFRHARDKQVRRTFLMISVILGVFVLTWSPYHILAIVKGFCDDCVPKSLYNLTYWFCYTNSPINPICYAFFNKKFRDAFYRVFHIKKNKLKNRTLHALITPNLPK